MVRKLFLAVFWFPAAATLLFFNIYFVARSYPKTKNVAMLPIISPLGDTLPINLSASTHTSQVLGSKVIAADARGKLLHNFLLDYDSPMAPYADLIVDEADKNGIDFRLVVAIAMCESNLGKHMPSNSYNAWGIAVYTGQQSGAVFSDWDHGIRWVSKYIKERYIDKGVDSLREIGAIYAPPSVLTGHSWSNCVESFQKSIF
jgi:hypothetical protein